METGAVEPELSETSAKTLNSAEVEEANARNQLIAEDLQLQETEDLDTTPKPAASADEEPKENSDEMESTESIQDTIIVNDDDFVLVDAQDSLKESAEENIIVHDEDVDSATAPEGHLKGTGADDEASTLPGAVDGMEEKHLEPDPTEEDISKEYIPGEIDSTAESVMATLVEESSVETSTEDGELSKSESLADDANSSEETAEAVVEYTNAEPLTLDEDLFDEASQAEPAEAIVVVDEPRMEPATVNDELSKDESVADEMDLTRESAEASNISEDSDAAANVVSDEFSKEKGVAEEAHLTTLAEVTTAVEDSNAGEPAVDELANGEIIADDIDLISPEPLSVEKNLNLEPVASDSVTEERDLTEKYSEPTKDPNVEPTAVVNDLPVVTNESADGADLEMTTQEPVTKDELSSEESVAETDVTSESAEGADLEKATADHVTTGETLIEDSVMEADVTRECGEGADGHKTTENPVSTDEMLSEERAVEIDVTRESADGADGDKTTEKPVTTDGILSEESEVEIDVTGESAESVDGDKTTEEPVTTDEMLSEEYVVETDVTREPAEGADGEKTTEEPATTDEMLSVEYVAETDVTRESADGTDLETGEPVTTDEILSEASVADTDVTRESAEGADLEKTNGKPVTTDEILSEERVAETDVTRESADGEETTEEPVTTDEMLSEEDVAETDVTREFTEGADLETGEPVTTDEILSAASVADTDVTRESAEGADLEKTNGEPVTTDEILCEERVAETDVTRESADGEETTEEPVRTDEMLSDEDVAETDVTREFTEGADLETGEPVTTDEILSAASVPDTDVTRESAESADLEETTGEPVATDEILSEESVAETDVSRESAEGAGLEKTTPEHVTTDEILSGESMAQTDVSRESAEGADLGKTTGERVTTDEILSEGRVTDTDIFRESAEGADLEKTTCELVTTDEILSEKSVAETDVSRDSAEGSDLGKAVGEPVTTDEILSEESVAETDVSRESAEGADLGKTVGEPVTTDEILSEESVAEKTTEESVTTDEPLSEENVADIDVTPKSVEGADLEKATEELMTTDQLLSEESVTVTEVTVSAEDAGLNETTERPATTDEPWSEECMADTDVTPAAADLGKSIEEPVTTGEVLGGEIAAETNMTVESAEGSDLEITTEEPAITDELLSGESVAEKTTEESVTIDSLLSEEKLAGSNATRGSCDDTEVAERQIMMNEMASAADSSDIAEEDSNTTHEELSKEENVTKDKQSMPEPEVISVVESTHVVPAMASSEMNPIPDSDTVGAGVEPAPVNNYFSEDEGMANEIDPSPETRAVAGYESLESNLADDELPEEKLIDEIVLIPESDGLDAIVEDPIMTPTEPDGEVSKQDIVDEIHLSPDVGGASAVVQGLDHSVSNEVLYTDEVATDIAASSMESADATHREEDAEHTESELLLGQKSMADKLELAGESSEATAVLDDEHLAPIHNEGELSREFLNVVEDKDKESTLHVEEGQREECLAPTLAVEHDLEVPQEAEKMHAFMGKVSDSKESGPADDHSIQVSKGGTSSREALKAEDAIENEDPSKEDDMETHTDFFIYDAGPVGIAPDTEPQEAVQHEAVELMNEENVDAIASLDSLGAEQSADLLDNDTFGFEQVSSELEAVEAAAEVSLENSIPQISNVFTDVQKGGLVVEVHSFENKGSDQEAEDLTAQENDAKETCASESAKKLNDGMDSEKNELSDAQEVPKESMLAQLSDITNIVDVRQLDGETEVHDKDPVTEPFVEGAEPALAITTIEDGKSFYEGQHDESSMETNEPASELLAERTVQRERGAEVVEIMNGKSKKLFATAGVTKIPENFIYDGHVEEHLPLVVLSNVTKANEAIQKFGSAVESVNEGKQLFFGSSKAASNVSKVEQPGTSSTSDHSSSSQNGSSSVTDLKKVSGTEEIAEKHVMTAGSQGNGVVNTDKASRTADHEQVEYSTPLVNVPDCLNTTLTSAVSDLTVMKDFDLNFSATQKSPEEVKVGSGEFQEEEGNVPLSTQGADLSSSWVSVSPNAYVNSQSRSGESLSSLSQRSQIPGADDLASPGDDWRIVSEHEISQLAASAPDKSNSRELDGGTKFPFNIFLWCSQSMSSLFGGSK